MSSQPAWPWAPQLPAREPNHEPDGEPKAVDV
jgi:hypothetical protein